MRKTKNTSTHSTSSNDDLNLYATYIHMMIWLLDSVTTFSKNISLKVLEDKYAYVRIERGVVVQPKTTIKINQLTIQLVTKDSYK